MQPWLQVWNHLCAGLTADRAGALTADQLVTACALELQAESRNASELVGQVQRAVENGHAPPVMLVDGLDEARAEAFSIAEELLTWLAPQAVTLASTREVRRGDYQPSLLGVLAPSRPGLDLDDPAAQDRALSWRVTSPSGWRRGIRVWTPTLWRDI